MDQRNKYQYRPPLKSADKLAAAGRSLMWRDTQYSCGWDLMGFDWEEIDRQLLTDIVITDTRKRSTGNS